MKFTPLLQINFSGYNRTVYSNNIKFTNNRPQDSFSSLVSNPELCLNNFYIESFNENGRYWMATPQCINGQNISNVSSIYSSTGKLIVTLSVNGKLVEAICSEIVNSQFVEIGGLLNSHHIFRDLKFFYYFSNQDLVFCEKEESVGGLHYRQILGKVQVIKDWGYVQSIRPYTEEVIDNQIQNRNLDIYGEAMRYFASSNTLKLSFQITDLSVKIILSEKESTHRRGDHDGGFEHDLITYSAFASKLFSSKYDLKKYLNKLVQFGYNINENSKETVFYKVNKTIYQLSQEFNVKFSYQYRSFTEPCD